MNSTHPFDNEVVLSEDRSTHTVVDSSTAPSNYIESAAIIGVAVLIVAVIVLLTKNTIPEKTNEP